jgi:hypothetical protein
MPPPPKTFIQDSHNISSIRKPVNVNPKPTPIPRDNNLSKQHLKNIQLFINNKYLLEKYEIYFNK